MSSFSCRIGMSNSTELTQEQGMSIEKGCNIDSNAIIDLVHSRKTGDEINQAMLKIDSGDSMRQSDKTLVAEDVCEQNTIEIENATDIDSSFPEGSISPKIKSVGESDVSTDLLQVSISSHQSAHTSPISTVRGRPRSGSGGSAKSHSFALDVMRRSRNNGSVGSFSTALSDENWINDWSQHSTSSQSSFLSSPSLQPRRRRGSASSATSMDESSFQFGEESLRMQKSNKVVNEQDHHKQLRRNQRREDAIKKYHQHYSSTSNQSPSQTMLESSNHTQTLSESDRDEANTNLNSISLSDTQEKKHTQTNTANYERQVAVMKPDVNISSLHVGNHKHENTLNNTCSHTKSRSDEIFNAINEFNTKTTSDSYQRFQMNSMGKEKNQSETIKNGVDNHSYICANMRSNRNNPRNIDHNTYFATFDQNVLDGTSVGPSHLFDATNAHLSEIYSQSENDYFADHYKIPQVAHGFHRNDSIGNRFTQNRYKERLHQHPHHYRDDYPNSFESFADTYEYLEPIQIHGSNVSQSHFVNRNHKNKRNHLIQNGLKESTERSTKVSFSTISIRAYNRILGDNPSCSNGPSLSIGWEYVNVVEGYNLEDFEHNRLYTRRLDHEMVLSRPERESILISLGYSQIEIARAVRANIKVKNQRRRTIHNLSFSKVEEAVETVRKKLTSAVKKSVLKKKNKNTPNLDRSLNGGGIGAHSRSDSHESSGSSFSSFLNENLEESEALR